MTNRKEIYDKLCRHKCGMFSHKIHNMTKARIRTLDHKKVNNCEPGGALQTFLLSSFHSISSQIMTQKIVKYKLFTTCSFFFKLFGPTFLIHSLHYVLLKAMMSRKYKQLHFKVMSIGIYCSWWFSSNSSFYNEACVLNISQDSFEFKNKHTPWMIGIWY